MASNVGSPVITWPASKKVLIASAGIAGCVALYALIRNRSRQPRRRITAFPSENEAIDGLDTAIIYLTKLSDDLIRQRHTSDSARNCYDLISTILDRLNGARKDYDKFRNNDFGAPIRTTEDIARHVWNKVQSPRASTLSILSDDTFVSALEDITPNFTDDADQTLVAFDFKDLALYQEGKQLVEKGEVRARKIRTELCGCSSDEDFLAKVYCIRLAFDKILSDDKFSQWLSRQGRVIFADLMRHDNKNPSDFFIAYDRLINFARDPENLETIGRELAMRRVEAVNLWDILFDFVLLDSLDDLRKPPSTIVALFRNNFFSRSLKESTLNSLLWSMLKMKRQKLQERDGFIAHFYDISQIMTPILIFAFFGDGPKAFQDLCLYLKDNIYTFVNDIFNVHKVRFTNLDDLAEDIRRHLESRLDLVYVKISNEIIDD